MGDVMYMLGKYYATKTCERTGNTMFSVRDGGDIAWLTMNALESVLYRHLTKQNDFDGRSILLAMVMARCENVKNDNQVTIRFSDN